MVWGWGIRDNNKIFCRSIRIAIQLNKGNWWSMEWLWEWVGKTNKKIKLKEVSDKVMSSTHREREREKIEFAIFMLLLAYSSYCV